MNIEMVIIMVHNCVHVTETKKYFCDTHTGQPIAWALSDKEDTNTLECFWSVIRKRCPSAAVTTLMTDDGMSPYKDNFINKDECHSTNANRHKQRYTYT